MDVFLSHSSADTKLAERLTESLEERGLSVWFDGHELTPGSDWRREVEEAIRSARNLVLLIDRQREPGRSQQFTWQTALEAVWEDPRKRLIPVLRRGAELPKFVLSGGAIWVVHLEDARILRDVVETIVKIVKGQALPRGEEDTSEPAEQSSPKSDRGPGNRLPAASYSFEVEDDRSERFEYLKEAAAGLK